MNCSEIQLLYYGASAAGESRGNNAAAGKFVLTAEGPCKPF
jgi:hypothetical protein